MTYIFLIEARTVNQIQKTTTYHSIWFPWMHLDSGANNTNWIMFFNLFDLRPTRRICILPRNFYKLLQVTHLTHVIKLRSKFMFKTVKIPHHTLALQDQHFEHLRIDEENLKLRRCVLPQYTLALHDFIWKFSFFHCFCYLRVSKIGWKWILEGGMSRKRRGALLVSPNITNLFFFKAYVVNYWYLVLQICGKILKTSSGNVIEYWIPQKQRMEWARKGGALFLSPPISPTCSLSKYLWSIIGI